MQQRSGKKGLYLFAADLEQPAHLRRIDLSAANVTVSRLVFGVDCDCQRLNGVHVNVRHLLDVLALFGFGAAHFAQTFLIESIQEMNQTGDQQAKKDERQSRAV